MNNIPTLFRINYKNNNYIVSVKHKVNSNYSIRCNGECDLFSITFNCNYDIRKITKIEYNCRYKASSEHINHVASLCVKHYEELYLKETDI